jgi:hypothetical protein
MLLSSFFKKLLVIGAIVSAVVTYYYLPLALNIFDIAITMNRNQAIEESQKIITSKNLLTAGYEHAAYFDEDTTLHYYIELAGGGKEVFKKLIEEHLIEPYTWAVRWYKEGETSEAIIRFTATGVPYSFSKKVPEAEAGAVLTEIEARNVAEKEAAKNWNIDFSVYRPFEYSKQEQPSKRVDHTFVYQRNDTQIAQEGKYRLKIIVSGGVVTTVSPFVFIPESFVRRYEEMRSENNTITIVALSLYRLLYLFGGVILLGIFLFYRRRLQYRYALLTAGIVSIAILGTLLSQWPFFFIEYNTALSKNSVWLMYFFEFGKKVAVTFATTFLFATVICAIDKWAFPKHESIWNFFSLERAARTKMLWYVLGGYLGVFIKLAGTTGIYLFLTGSWIRWWAPASQLVNPNVLALGLPWLEPVVQSFNAGFTEELLFRAIPLSVAVLLGRFFNQKKLFIIVGLFIQALVFTALHANYPMYPAYFRIIEMFPSALIYGILYLCYGLIPGIIIHWLYDLFLMSLPIMVSTASGIFLQKIIIVIIGLLPLLYVLYARYSIGCRVYEPEADQLDVHDYNAHVESQKDLYDKTYVISLLNMNYDRQESFLDQFSSSSKFVLIVLMGLLAGGLGYKKYKNSSDYSRAAIVSKDFVCDDSCKRMMIINPDFLASSKQLYRLESHANSPRPRSSFAWRTMSHEKYFSLVDRYVYPVAWNVRYARFDGTQVERAEEYQFMYSKSGELLWYVHTFSDQVPGKGLNEEQARASALKKIVEMYKVDTTLLQEISCQSIKKPSRLDWTFTFEDRSIQLDQGKARILVTVSGDEVCHVAKYIFVPEGWMRNFDQEDVYKKMVLLFIQILFYFIVVLGVGYLKDSIFAIFNLKRFCITVVVFMSAFLASIYFRFSMIIYNFKTSISWANQVVSYFAPQFVVYIIMSLLLGLALVSYFYSATIGSTRKRVLLDVLFFALIFIVFQSCMGIILPRNYPELSDPTVLNNMYSGLWFVLECIIHIIQSIICMYLSIMGLNRATQWGTRYRWFVPCFMFFITAYILDFSLFSIYYLLPLIVALLIVSVVMTILYYSVIRYDFFTYLKGYVLFIICSAMLQLPEQVLHTLVLPLAVLIGYYLLIYCRNRFVSC